MHAQDDDHKLNFQFRVQEGSKPYGFSVVFAGTSVLLSYDGLMAARKSLAWAMAWLTRTRSTRWVLDSGGSQYPNQVGLHTRLSVRIFCGFLKRPRSASLQRVV